MKKAKVVIIAAMDLERGIGIDNHLPWHLPEDMKFFKEVTTGHTVVMGRKNWESIPEKYRPLPNRRNIVLTRNADYVAEGAEVSNDLVDCVIELSTQLEETETIFIIGGAEIYKAALDADIVDEMLITQINSTFDCDTFFPDTEQYRQWDEAEHQLLDVYEENERRNFDFTIHKYTKTL